VLKDGVDQYIFNAGRGWKDNIKKDVKGIDNL
jgi:hypothetical protein